MDEDLVLREIIKNLAFEIEAVNQENVLKWSTNNGTPLNVKVRVRNKDEPRLVQRGTMPVPRIGISAPEKLGLVSSNQTILSFSVYLQDEYEKKEKLKRHSGFKLFNIGSCLGTYSDDDGPYLPSSSNQNAIGTVGSHISIMSSSSILKKKVSQDLTTSNAVPRNKKGFFGKCKPGGCLDPPFGEDHYSYDNLSKADRQKSPRGAQNKLDEKISFKPGGCLDPHYIEEKCPYTPPKTDNLEKLGQKLYETKKSGENENLVQKTTKDEGNQKIITNLYDRTSEDRSLIFKHSNSIITYPIDIHAKERLYENNTNKNKVDDSLRLSYESPESYFVPPKDIIRYKEEERRNIKRFSMDQLSRSSKVSANGVADQSNLLKSLSKESKYKESKDALKEKLTLKESHQNDNNIASKDFETKGEIAIALTQLSIGLNEIPKNDVPNFKNDCLLQTSDNTSIDNNLKYQRKIDAITAAKSNKNQTEIRQDDTHISEMEIQQGIPSTRSTSKETQFIFSSKNIKENKTINLTDDIHIGELLVKHEMPLNQRTSEETLTKFSLKKADEDRNENLEDNINISNLQRKEGKLSNQDTSKDTISKISQSETPHSSSTRILYNQKGQNQEQVKDEKLGIPTHERLVNKSKDIINKGDKMYEKEGASTILPPTSVVEKEKQSLQGKEKLNDIITSVIQEKNIFKESPNKSINLSPNYISNTENNEFDICSSHSMDLKQELLDTGNKNDLLNKTCQKDIPNNNTKIKNDLSDIKMNSNLEEIKTSVIFQKIPFMIKQETVINNDDNNKAIPLKRNTFTIIGSGTSLQKSEQNEEEDMPIQIINDVHFKTTDKTKSGSTNSCKIETTYEENKINSISANKKKQDNLKDMYSKTIENTEYDESDRIGNEEERLGESVKVKQSENDLNTHFDNTLKQKYDSGTTNTQINILDTMTQNAINNALQKPSLNVKDTVPSNPTEYYESTVRRPLKTNVLDNGHPTEYTINKDIYVDADRSQEKNTDDNKKTKTTLDRKSLIVDTMSDEVAPLEGKSDRLDLIILPKSTSEHEQTTYMNVSNDGHVALSARKYNTLEVDSTAFNRKEPIIENGFFSEIAEVDNITGPPSCEVDIIENGTYNTSYSTHSYSDPTYDKGILLHTKEYDQAQKCVPERDPDFYSLTSDKIHEKINFEDQRHMELGRSSSKIALDKVFSDEKTKNLLTFTQMPLKTPHSVNIDQTSDNEEVKSQITNVLDNFKSSPSVKDDVSKVKLANAHNVYELTKYSNEDDSSGQTYDSEAFLDSYGMEQSQNNKPEQLRNFHLASIGHVKTEQNYETYNELANIKDSKSASDALLAIQSETVQELPAHAAYKDIVSSDKISNEKMVLDANNIELTQKFIPEHGRDLHSVMSYQSYDKTEINNHVLSEMDNFNHSESNKNDVLKTKSENILNLHAGTTYNEESTFSDQLYSNKAQLNSQSIESIQKASPKYVRDLESAIDKTEKKYDRYNNMDIDMYSESFKDNSLTIKSENGEGMLARTANNNQVSDKRAVVDLQTTESVQNLMPESVRDLQSIITDQNHDKTEISYPMYKEIQDFKHSERIVDDFHQMKSGNIQSLHAQADYKNEYSASDTEPKQKLIAKYTQNTQLADISPEKLDNLLGVKSENFNESLINTPGDLIDSSSNQNYDRKVFLDPENNETTLKFLKEQIQEMQSVKNIDSRDPNDQIYNELICNESDTNDDKSISTNGKHASETLFAPYRNTPQDEIENSNIVDDGSYSRKYHEQMELTQNLTGNVQEFKDLPKSDSEKNSPFSGYSGLMSEVLSNISENIEGEEINYAHIKVAEGVSTRLLDIVFSNTKAYRDDETLHNEFANIVEESGLIKNTSRAILPSNNKVEEEGDYNGTKNSYAKTHTSTLEKTDKNMHKEIITKMFGSSEFIAHSSYTSGLQPTGLRTDSLNIVGEDVLLTKKIGITNQNSEYQSSNILTSINYPLKLNGDSLPFTYDERFVKQTNVNESKLNETESTSLRKDPIYLDMSFYSYMNEKKQIVVQTHSPRNQQHHPYDGTVTVVKTLIRHGNEIRIPVDKENDIALNILEKDVKICNKAGIIGSLSRHTRREKHVVDLAKRHDEVINKNLALIYENELIPLHNVIKDLAQEVNILSAQQERLRMRIRNTKRTKSLRLIPVVKRCGCRRT